MPLKIDLHVHTCYSCDATTTIEEVIACSRKQGLDGVAITDHDNLKGALRLLGETEIIVIPGIEVDTSQGHVLGLNIVTSIPPSLGVFQTIQKIHEAGGIAVAAHPAVIGRSIKGMNVRANPPLNFDAVEVINANAFPFLPSTRKNQKLASRFNLPQTAGSDSHIPQTIGMAYTLIDADPDVNEIVQAIKKGATFPIGRPLPWSMRLKKIALSMKKVVKRGD